MYNSPDAMAFFEDHVATFARDIREAPFKYTQELIDTLVEWQPDHGLVESLEFAEEPCQIIYCLLKFSTFSPMHECAGILSRQLAERKTKEVFPTWSLDDEEAS